MALSMIFASLAVILMLAALFILKCSRFQPPYIELWVQETFPYLPIFATRVIYYLLILICASPIVLFQLFGFQLWVEREGGFLFSSVCIGILCVRAYLLIFAAFSWFYSKYTMHWIFLLAATLVSFSFWIAQFLLTLGIRIFSHTAYAALFMGIETCIFVYLIHAKSDQRTINVSEFYEKVFSFFNEKLEKQAQKPFRLKKNVVEEVKKLNEIENSEMSSIPEEYSDSAKEEKPNAPLPPIPIDKVDSSIEEQAFFNIQKPFDINGAFSAVCASKDKEIKTNYKEELNSIVKSIKEKNKRSSAIKFLSFIIGLVFANITYAVVYW